MLQNNTLPKEITFVANKLIENHLLYDEVKNLLRAIITKLNNDSANGSSFCDILKTPDGLAARLLKVFGINDRQCLDAFEKIGFFKGNRMYADLYYQTLSLLYYVGVLKNDILLRQYVITLMYIKIFNGRKYKWMPNGCQEDIAQYLIANVFRNSHTFKKYPNPFMAIINYFAPTLDNTYYPYVKRDPANPNNGIVVILKQAWVRMDQVFAGVKDHYYEAYRAGNRISVSSQAGLGNTGQEVDSIEFSKVEHLVQKIQRTLMFKPPVLAPDDLNYLKSSMYMVSDLFISKVQEYLNEEESEDDIKNILELFFSVLGIQQESSLCTLNIVQSVNGITNAKGNNVKITHLKTYIDSLLNAIFKGVTSASSSQLLKLRKDVFI